MAKRALVIVDYQKDFVDGALGFVGAENIEENIEGRIKEYLYENDDIYFTFDTHGEDYMLTVEGKHLPVLHCIKGTCGHELYGNIKDYLHFGKVFEKSTFGSLELAETIRDKGYSQVEVCGLVSNICVLSNIILIRTLSKNTEITVDLNCILSSKDEINTTFEHYLRDLGVNLRG